MLRQLLKMLVEPTEPPIPPPAPPQAPIAVVEADMPIEEAMAQLGAVQADQPWCPVGFQNSATGLDLGFYAARSYSLMRPPRTGRRLIRFWERSATGWSGRGGRSWRLRWGRRPL